MKRSRKGGRRQHLSKVGTHESARHEQHLEREAIADTMGFGGSSSWVKWVAAMIIVLIVVGGLVSLIALD
jgi:hypothetical protein